MKLTTVIFLSITIFGVMCAKQTYQPKFIPGLTTKDKLSKSHMGIALMNMIQLGNTTEADFDELYSALNFLKETLTSKKQAEVADFRDDGEAHRLNNARMTRLINTYDNQAILFQDELDVLIVEGESLTGTLKNQQSQQKTAEGQQQSENELLSKLAEDYDSQARDYQVAIDLLGEAVTKLNEARTSQGTFGSFLETNKSNFQDLQSRIGTTLLNLRAKSTISKPINQFFTQLTTSEPSSATIGRAVEALQNLREYYEQGLTQQTQNFNIATEEHTNLLNQINVQIGNLTYVIIPKTQQDLESNQEAQGIRTSQLAESQRNSTIESGNLDAENESWEKRIELHEMVMPQYSEEYAIVEQAEVLLRQQD